MKTSIALAIICATVALAATVAVFHSRSRPANPEPQKEVSHLTQEPIQTVPEPATPEVAHPQPPIAVTARQTVAPQRSDSDLSLTTNKLERLTRTRETYRRLAAGDPAEALRAAKQVTDPTERETALLTLVTEWTQGELRPPRQRAHAVDVYGLEAGLGIELAKHPELAVLWANEMTDGAGRTAILQQTALAMIDSDPAAAFALSSQLGNDEQRQFFDSVFAGWASNDTDAALNWARELADDQRDAALQAIRTVAPVGIGAALSIEEGYPVINQLLPGTPAELSGQLHPGDRILALAQAGSGFVDTHSLPLADVVQMIRGEPGTVLQLQVLAADASPNTQPRTISITRDQIRMRR